MDIYFQNRWHDSLLLVVVVVFAFALFRRYKRESVSVLRGRVLFTLRALAAVMGLIAIQNPTLLTSETIHKQKRLLFVLDDILSMNITPGKFSRYEEVLEVLENVGQSQLVDKFTLPLVRLSEPHSTFIEDFNEDSFERVTSHRPQARSSPLKDVVKLQLSRFDLRNLAGIVLLTDGRSTSESEIWNEIKSKKIPVHTLLPANVSDASDSRISSMVGQSTCRVGDVIKIQATIQHQGAPAQNKITFKKDDTILEQRFVNLGGEDVVSEVKIKMEVPGWHKISASILDQDPVTENNERIILVNVIDEPLKVFLASGQPHYDFRYLREALQRDETVELSLYLQTADEKHGGWGGKKTANLRSFPDSLEAFLKYDVVILQDIDPARVNERNWAILRRYVEEAQGALLIQAGRNFHFPESARGTQLNSLLPYAPSSKEHTRMFRPIDPDENFVDVVGSRPKSWPEFFWAAGVKKLMPLTSVLLSHPTAKTDDGQPLPLISWARRGRGKVGVIGLAHMWRLRNVGGRQASLRHVRHVDEIFIG